MANRIQLRRDTAANWSRVNPILEDGEPGLETDTNRVKYGDGNTRWNSLAYATAEAVIPTGWAYEDPETEYVSTANLAYNFSVDVDRSHLDINGAGDWEIGSNHFDTKIFSTAEIDPDPRDIVIQADGNNWLFARTGALNLPVGGSIVFPDSTVQSTAYTGSVDLSNYQGNIYINSEGSGLIVDAAGDKRVGFMKYFGIEASFVHANGPTKSIPFQIGRVAADDITLANNSVFTSEIYIAANGKVGINTVGPEYQLDVSGDIRSIGNIIATEFRFANGVNILSTVTVDQSLSANVGAYQIYANANAATQATGIDAINANIGAYQTFANANVSSIQNQIFASNANIGAFQTYANATFGASSYGNTEVAAYLLTWPNIDSNILDVTSGNITTLRANNFSTGNAVISGGYISALTNASISTATIATLNSTGGNITTLRATNFSTANAVITGGYINSLANLTATTAVFTNFSTGNAVISGGYISALSNAYITTSAITNFSTANAVITGGYASGLANVTVTGNVTAGNLIGYGSNTTITAGTYTSTFDNVGMVTVPNLTVSGSVDATSITTDSLTINDTGWTNFTPTWYAGTGTNSVGDGLAEGRYRQLGKTVEVWMQITMGSTTTFGTGEYKVSLPVASRMLGSAVLSLVMSDTGTRLYNSLAHNAYTTTLFHTSSNVTLFWDTGVVTNTSPFTWTNGDFFVIAGTYEAS